MTIFSDAAGNKYLGDCRWGNYDINYPATNFLKAVDTRTLRTTFLADMLALFTDAGWGNISVPAPWSTTNGGTIFSATIPGQPSGNYFRLRTGINAYSFRPEQPDIANVISPATFGGNSASMYGQNFDYVVACGQNSLAFKPFDYSANYSQVGIGGFYWDHFFYWGKLLDVNTNFSYYNSSFINHSVMIWSMGTGNTVAGINIQGIHYISSAIKDLLETGRAAYTISCSDGQTPGAQWATDMWVYDNNATLGYPVIGRVPNMLLGIGTYTHLKPVKIQGSVFPDNGSPWYLPVGTYAGKTLLMRCYSSAS